MAGWEPRTDYSETIYVDPRLLTAGLVDSVGDGLLKRNDKPRFADVLDGLSNTIMYAESAGRPFVYRRLQKVSPNLLAVRVNGGGWCRPASEISIDGADGLGVVFPGPTADQRHEWRRLWQHRVSPSLLRLIRYGRNVFVPSRRAHVAFGDGSVRFLGETIGIREYARLVTRANAEVVTQLTNLADPPANSASPTAGSTGGRRDRRDSRSE